jgi:aryl-alcohol dehydrogenase-like predicted oxidoreductase
MEYRYLGRSGVVVSALCLGTVYFGTQVAADDAERIIWHALDRGVTFIDTAENYMRPRHGIAEEVVGKALGGRRHDVFLATKKRYDPSFVQTGTPSDHVESRGQIIRAIEGSLRRLRTDYVDLYYPHQVDPNTPLDETLGAIDDLVRSGKVRYVGLSNHAAWQTTQALWLAELHDYQPISCVQVLYNLLDRAIERELIPCCDAYSLGIVPYSPLAGGVLTGKYGSADSVPGDSRAALIGFRTDGRPGHVPILSKRNLEVSRRLGRLAADYDLPGAALAIAWVMHQSAVSSVIFGASSVDQLAATLAAAQVRLTAGELAAIASCNEESSAY